MKKADNLGIKTQVKRPLKIVFLGAGSAFFQPLFIDVMSIPGAEKGTMCLVDIDKKRLDIAEKLGNFILDKTDSDWELEATTDRLEVLEGADYVVNCIEVSGVDCVKLDYDIPKKYGIDQCVGDTIGAGGLFKALRTVPVFLKVLKDIERLCPDAYVLNYTNPMSIMCLAAARTSSAKVVGLCHSVQGSSHDLAEYTGVPYTELKWKCGGINHLAWFTKLEHKGKDLYPELIDKTKNDKEFLAKDPVRFDIMQNFGAFVTESSGHFSEYVPFYRKRDELIDEHCGEGYLGERGFYAKNWPRWRDETDEKKLQIIDGEEDLKTDRSWEYCSYIIQAIETNNPFIIYGSVPNTGLIPNLPQDGVVELACVCDGRGINPTYFGKVPSQLAALCDWNMRSFDLAADACIEKSKEKAIHSLMLDPLTAAVCSPGEIRDMANELFEAEKEFLPGFE